MRCNPLAAVLLTIFYMAPHPATADDWPQFLGPNRNGTSSETGLIESVDDDSIDILWKQPLGVGMAGIAVTDGSAFTVFQDADNQYLTALDVASGQPKWKTAIAPAYENAMGNGPRATPTVADNRVYAFSGEGILAAVSADDGKLLWSVNTPKDMVCKPSEYGMASSPLIVDDTVVVQVGSHRGSVVAYHQQTGQQKWTAGEGFAGYSSPILTELAGRKQIVALAGKQVLGIDPADGTVLWSHAFETDFDCNTASPVTLDATSVLISAGENHGSTILNIKESAGTFSATSTWDSFGKDSVLRAEWQTPVVFKGHVYALDNVGGAGPITNLVCLRLSDCEQVWSQPRFGKSNLILADGKLFFSTMRGELVIVQATADGFHEKGRAVVSQATRQAPTLANGRLYFRDNKNVVCVQATASP